MPQIKVYNQQVSASGPMESRKLTGDDFGGGAGRIYQAAGAAVEETGNIVYKAEESRESSEAHAEIGNAHAEFTNELNAQLKDGSIKSEQFMEKFDEKIGKLSGNYTTKAAKEYFQKSSGSLRSNFLVSSVSAQSTVTAKKAEIDFVQARDKLSTGIMADPSSYSTALEAHEMFIIQKINDKTLDYDQGQELLSKSKRDFAVSAVRGWAQLDPEDAQAQLKQGLWDDAFDGNTKKQMMSEASQAISARKTEEMHRESEQRKAKDSQDRDTQNKMLTGMYAGKLSTNDILKSNLDFEAKDKMLSMMRTQLEEGTKIRSDAKTKMDLYQRIQLPEGDPKRPTDEEIKGLFNKGLTLPDINDLLKEKDSDNSPEAETRKSLKKTFFETARAKLVKKNPIYGEDADGLVRLAQFTADFGIAYEQAKVDGKRDIDLFNPNHKDYMGLSINNYVPKGSDLLKQFSRPKNDVVINPIKGTPLALPPEKRRNEGESIEAWRARTKGK